MIVDFFSVAYPWNNVKSVCDVGSGLGAFSRSLLERFPDVRVVQFDLAPTIAMAEQVNII